DVIKIEFGVLMHWPITSAADLPPAGKPWPNVVTTVLPRLVPLDDLDEFRTGPDQAHVTGDDVEQLWQLVNAQPAEPLPNARDARIIGDLVAPFAVRAFLEHEFFARCIGHGAEFEDRERTSM